MTSNEHDQRGRAGVTPDQTHSPTADEEAVEQVLREVEAQAIGTPDHALHLYYALTDAIDQLNAGPVLAALEAHYPAFRTVNRGGASVDRVHDRAAVFHDSLADFDKQAAALLQQWMIEHGLTEVRLNVWMPCHLDYTQFVVSARETPYEGDRDEA